jgi:3-deoxy-D-manno-octulosonic-acid transferase
VVECNIEVEPKKRILLVMPTVGEAVQGFQLCREIKKAFHDSRIYGVVEDDAHSVAKCIDEIEKVLVYDNDTEDDASRVFDSVNPSIILFIENCYHPHLLIEAKKRTINTLLISAVMNSAILHHPRYEKCFLLGAYKMFSSVGVKSPEYIDEFVALGVEAGKLFVSGDLKMDWHRLTMADDQKRYYKRLLGLEGRGVFIAGSISREEGKDILEVCRRLRETENSVKSVIAPRFLHNILDLKVYAQEMSLSVATKTELTSGANEEIRDAEVVLLDTYGELGWLYGLGDAIFVGGTLRPFDDKPLGQNILEPLFHGKPIVVGPNVKKDLDVIEKLRGFWANTMIRNPDELFKSILFLLLNRTFRDAYALFVRNSFRFDDDNDISALIEKLRAEMGECNLPSTAPTR